MFSKYVIDSNKLYMRFFVSTLLKCLGLEDTYYALREVHERIYRVHIGVKALTRQVIRAEFFQPTLWANAEEFMGKCEKCQMYAQVNKQPTT